MSSFQDISVWQKSKEFYVEMYQDFKKVREFYFKDQLLRATLSISNNIAEGHDRHTDKEYLRFLYFAKGSASEVHSMLIIARELTLIESEIIEKRTEQIIEISKMLGGLIRTISKSVKSRS